MQYLRGPSSLVLILVLLLAGCAANGRKSMDRGKKYMKEKDYARALIEFRNALRHFPKDPDVHYHVALGFLANNDLTNGVRHLRMATELNQNHAEAQTKLAELMATLGDNDIVREAERRAKLALAVSTNNQDAIATLAVAELRLGKTAEAEKRLQEMIDKSPQAMRAALVMANLKLSRGDTAEAEKILKTAAQNNSGSWEVWFSLSRFYVLQNRIPEAEDALKRSVAADPNNELTLQALAALQRAQNRLQDAEQTYQKLAQHPSKRYLGVHAVFLFETGRREEAVKQLEQVYRSNPKDRTLRTQLVSALLATNRSKQAEEVLAEALKQNPKDVDALLQRGQALLLAGRFGELELDMNQVLKFKSDSGEAHYLLARAHRARGNTKSEKQELYEALRVNSALLIARIDLTQRMIAEGAGKAAMDLMNAAPEEQKKTMPWIIQKNWALWAVKDTAKFREGLKAGYEQGRWPEQLMQDAVLQMSERKFGPARELLKEAQKANPDDLRILQTLAESHLLEANPTGAGNVPMQPKALQAAVSEVAAVAAKYPKSATVQHFYGNWLAMTGKLGEARNAFVAAKTAAPDSKGAAYALAQVDLATGNLEGARKTLDETLAKDPRDPSANLLVAMLDERMGKVDAATNSYRKVIEAEPTNPVALNNLAYRLVTDAATADEALKYAQKAKEAAPTSAAIDDTIGWIYYKKGLYSSAVKYLESATSGSNASPVRLFHLAMAYHKSGAQAKARETYQKANKVGALLPEAALAKQTLGIQ